MRATIKRDYMSYYISMHRSDPDCNSKYLLKLAESEIERFQKSGIKDATVEVSYDDKYLRLSITNR